VVIYTQCLNTAVTRCWRLDQKIRLQLLAESFDCEVGLTDICWQTVPESWSGGSESMIAKPCARGNARSLQATILRTYIGCLLVNEWSSRRPWWFRSISTVLLLPTSATSAYLPRPSLVDRTCNLHSVKSNCSARADCRWGSEVSLSVNRPSGTVCRLHQSCHRTPSGVHWRHTCYWPLGTVETFHAIPAPNTDAQTYLLTVVPFHVFVGCHWRHSVFGLSIRDGPKCGKRWCLAEEFGRMFGSVWLCKFSWTSAKIWLYLWLCVCSVFALADDVNLKSL